MITQEEQTVNTDDNRPEPYATVLDLINDHGYYAVLEAVSDEAQFEAEDDNEEYCAGCRKRAAQLHLELEHMLTRMDDFDDAVCGEPSNEPAAS
jgi:hypothetical protein